MRVLITGGNCGLGLQLVKVFHENGHIVYPLVRTEAHYQHVYVIQFYENEDD